MPLDDGVTRWLREWRDGDDGAIDRVTEEIYKDLRRLAGHYLSGEQSGHTLPATALVHEAYLHLAEVRDFDWKARGHFVAVMAQMMRRILIDHARARRAAKRDASAFEPVTVASGDAILDVVLVDEALTRLAAVYPRHAEAVQLRFFGGLSSPEIATVLSTSLATVERDWRFAKAWLADAIGTPAP